MFQFLFPGDVLFLDTGFRVNSEEIPAYCYPGKAPRDTSLCRGSILIGDTMRQKNSTAAHSFEIGQIIKAEFTKRKLPLDENILQRFLDHQLPKFNGEPYHLPEGFYLISKVEMNGARHEVYCETYQVKEDQVIRRFHFTIVETGFENRRDIAIVPRGQRTELNLPDP